MTGIAPSTSFAAPRGGSQTAVSSAPAAAVSGRDPRLDFYRGLAMFIILIAHIPYNAWAGWIPARFGFSDATEIFVFCSGMASAVAFGGAFLRRGWLMGTARVLFRCWQVYWAHICLFFFTLTAMAALDLYGGFDKSYIDDLNLRFVMDDPAPQLVGMFTLTYVPNYFDILPMYLVILAMLPLVMALARIGTWAVALFCVALWSAANIGSIHFPAEPWSAREWFFNPFGWQLLFFTGFAFMRGWIPAPPVSRALVWICAAFLILSAPIGSWKVFEWVNAAAPALGDSLRGVWRGIDALDKATGFALRDKTDFSILRYLHFLALAYVAWVAAGPGGAHLRAVASGAAGEVWRGLLAIVTKVGQQSLAVFVASMAIARLLGFVLDQIGRTGASYALVNLIGFAIIIAVAYVAGWFKSQPWKTKRT
ncbi:MAG: hypothetical protein CML02_18360 [Pseudooceanicola sp.]|jgi:hypothetical protein|nr:hypothetical protein [Pseudooceanicola sp.]